MVALARKDIRIIDIDGKFVRITNMKISHRDRQMGADLSSLAGLISCVIRHDSLSVAAIHGDIKVVVESTVVTGKMC